jgi:SMI1 / KNR4 family (SUKH-1)
MTNAFDASFPAFARLVRERQDASLEELLPPASAAEIEQLENELGVPLPASYKKFLRCSRALWLFGGAVQMSKGHPFFHHFPAFEELTLPQRRVVSQRGGKWPPPSDGMLCFAEFFLEADGDQVLFDVSNGSSDGEYPVIYYAHEIPSVRKYAGGFQEWLDTIDHAFASHSGDGESDEDGQ